MHQIACNQCGSGHELYFKTYEKNDGVLSIQLKKLETIQRKTLVETVSVCPSCSSKDIDIIE